MVVESNGSNGSSNGTNGHGGARERKLGNATCRQILDFITHKQKVTVNEITESLPYSRATIDKYIKILRQNDIIVGKPKLGQANCKLWQRVSWKGLTGGGD